MLKTTQQVYYIFFCMLSPIKFSWVPAGFCWLAYYGMPQFFLEPLELNQQSHVCKENCFI